MADRHQPASPEPRPRLFPMRLLGFGLFLAWGTLIASFEQAHDVASLSSPVARLVVSSVLTALVCLGAAGYVHVTGKTPWSKRTVVLCGTWSVLFAGFVLAASWLRLFPLDLVALAFKAVAYAGLFLMWNVQLSAHPPKVAWISYAGSMALAACAYLLVAALGPLATTTAMVALPVASCTLLGASMGLSPSGDETAPESSEPIVWKIPWRPIVLIAAFSFVQAFVGHYDGSTLGSYEWGRLVAAVVILLPLLVSFDHFAPDLVARVACPALIIAALALCNIHGFNDSLGAKKLLASTAYYMFTLYIYLTLSSLCYRYRVRAEWLFGPACAADMLATPLGALAGNRLNELAGQEAYAAVDLAVGIVGVLVVLVCMALMASRSFEETWKIQGHRIARDADGTVTELPATGDYYRDRLRQCALVARHFGLTHREEEVLTLMSEGKSFQEIEALLSIAHATLRTHVQHIYAKLGVHSGEQACRMVGTWRS